MHLDKPIQLTVAEYNRQRLSEFLRDLRHNSDLTQGELRETLDYKNASTISKNENGKSISVPYLTKLANSLNLSLVERHYLLGLKGEIPPTLLPNKQEIINNLSIYYKTLQQYPFPALLVDHCFGIWAMNAASSGIITLERVKEIFKQNGYLTVFDMLLDKKLQYNQNLSIGEAVADKDLARIIKEQISLFKWFNIMRQHEAFYIRYSKYGWRFTNRALSQDRFFREREFEYLWNSSIVFKDGKPTLEEASVSYTAKIPASKRKVTYKQKIEPTIPLSMFGVIKFEPISKNAEEAFNREPENATALWELHPELLDTLIKQLNNLNQPSCLIQI